MEANVWSHRIDILGAALPKDSWEPLLDELNAEHVPCFTPTGKRLFVVPSPTGRLDAFIYRTIRMDDHEVVRILKKHGIDAVIRSV